MMTCREAIETLKERAVSVFEEKKTEAHEHIRQCQSKECSAMQIELSVEDGLLPFSY